MKYQGRSKRKRTGGRLKQQTNKKRHELGREPTETTVGEQRFRTIDARGNGTKMRVLSTDSVAVATGDSTEQTTLENVVDNPANVNYARRNIVTKGAIIETGLGEARVTSRPGQHGQVNAVLLDE